MWWEIYISVYQIRALIWPVSCTKGWGNISTPWEKVIIDGGLNTEAIGLENEDFSDEDQCQCMYTWEFFAYIFFGIRKTPTRKIPTWEISTNQTPPWQIPAWKIPTQKTPAWNIFTHVFKYSNPSFLFFFHYCYHWYYLSLYVCEH